MTPVSHIRILASCFVLACGLCGCEDTTPLISDVSPGAQAEKRVLDGQLDVRPSIGITWYAGSAEEAFTHAKENEKPVFFYWGAEWCPPCHVIKATVFSSRAFIERSKSFVAVYLDGDTESAQALGETYEVFGYPTMIIFDSYGNELTRIRSGIDIQAYADVLDLAFIDVAPAADILRKVANGGEALTEAECQLMTYSTWYEDPSLQASYDALSVYEKLEAGCPKHMTTERSVLFFNRMMRQIYEPPAGRVMARLTVPEKENELNRIRSILNDYALVKLNSRMIAGLGAQMTAGLTVKGTKERQQLQDGFILAFEQLINDEDVYIVDRLYTLHGRINFERIDNSQVNLSQALRDEVTYWTGWANEVTRDPYYRPSIINAAATLLNEAGMRDAAKSMLLVEIKTSIQPHNLMSSLAALERKEGNVDEAMSWYKQAYDASTGPATRFQWGQGYVVGLLEMAPKNIESIRDATIKIIQEVETTGGFYNRSKTRLNELEAKLYEWSDNEDNSAVLRAIRDEVQLICTKSSEGNENPSPCETFLEAA